jgi:hypothetical protein
MPKRWIVPLLIAAACLAGCGRHARPLPEVYPVHGRVTYPDSKPVADGIIQFISEADTSISASAMIGSDGRYSLVTKRDRLQAEGAPAGLCRVVVTPPFSDKNGRRSASPTVFPAPYRVEPHDNEINLTIGGSAGTGNP